MKAVINFKVEIPDKMDGHDSGKSTSLLVTDAALALANFCVQYERKDPESTSEIRWMELENGVKVSWDADNPSPQTTSDGAGLIAAERRRQVTKEGWTAEHDDAHNAGELADAAVCYALDGPRVFTFWARNDVKHETRIERNSLWPWPNDKLFWKPSARDIEERVLPQGDKGWCRGRIHDLTKAGALIAAEIDRLQRVIESGSDEKEES